MMNSPRRLAAALAFAAATALPLAPHSAVAKDDPLSREAMYEDPDAPVSGNPKGDVTIVAFLDYNCPYCKKSVGDLKRIVRDDGKIRLIYKEWPILGNASKLASRLALAANYQGKYEAAHEALMRAVNHASTRAQLVKALGNAGIDTTRLEADLAAHGKDIDRALARNDAQGDIVGFQGAPTYLIGPLVSSTLDYAGFKRAVADARARQPAAQ
ncbi:DsbA family protein [Rhodomicrobium sp.]|uniref:DsbA family protein n=1 Tax=Rhodomicrobium sp. TaxID=2720632 RepID=UPI0039E2B88C